MVASAATGVTLIKSVPELISAIGEVRKQVEPYSSDVKGLKIDYLSLSVELTVYVKVPDSGISRALHKIRIPTGGPFKFRELRTGLWDRVPIYDFHDGPVFEMKASLLPPSCEDFLFIFEGKLTPEALSGLVVINSSIDPMNENGADVYWLTSAINHPDMLRRIYESIEVDKVNVSVQVLLSRHFFTSLPPTTYRLLQAREQLQTAVQTRDRNLEKKARFTLQKTAKRQVFTENQLLQTISELVSQATLRDHVTASEPYQVVRVDPDEKRTSLIPERFAVQAGTLLDYQHKLAKGTLKFAREDYKKAVADRVGKIVS